MICLTCTVAAAASFPPSIKGLETEALIREIRNCCCCCRYSCRPRTLRTREPPAMQREGHCCLCTGPCGINSQKGKQKVKGGVHGLKFRGTARRPRQHTSTQQLGSKYVSSEERDRRKELPARIALSHTKNGSGARSRTVAAVRGDVVQRSLA